jgi:NADH-quinone oxidoreductase subunit L
MQLWLIPVLPLIGSAINGLLGRKFSKSTVAIVGLLFPGLAMLYAWEIAYRFIGGNREAVFNTLPTWIAAGNFHLNWSFQLDQLSCLMLLVVTTIGFVIHVYSVGYMEHEGGYYRFFSYLNLFMFFMLMLVLADNYLVMFVGWEGVGLASYLLIGFFFLRDSAAAAGKKAFITNRVGDFSFLIALFLLIQHFGSLQFTTVFEKISHLPQETGYGLLTIIGLLMLGGAAGKSAQIPLYVWLPDAMEGPTPVSALIHAATMVTAGVYMICRSHAIFDRAPNALLVVAIIGTLTAFFAATIGIVQHDIKRVLAYSTVSQLGYMFAAAGVAAYGAAMFHLMTHAFFKALLFLAAGSVIHGLSGEQDMRKMGGLRKDLPWTFWTMTAATFAIAGMPGLSGFFSKDLILFKVFSSPFGSHVLWAVLLITAFLTSFYMFRLWFLTFFGEFRGTPAEVGHGQHHEHKGQEKHQHHGHAHESPKMMLVPLAILAVLSIVGGYVGLGEKSAFGQFLAPIFSQYSAGLPAATVSGGEAEAEPNAVSQTTAAPAPEQPESGLEYKLMGAAICTFFGGLGLAWYLYYKRPDLPPKYAASMHGLYTTVSNKYYVDDFYGAAIIRPIVAFSTSVLWKTVDAGLIDGTINESAAAAGDVSNAFRRMQSGNIRSYAGWVAFGAAAVIAFMAWTGATR